MYIDEQFLTVNPYSRPGVKLLRPEYLVIHWVANPRTTAQQNRDFWESRKDGSTGFGSGHFVVDDTGAIQCAPIHEMLPHVGTGNGITEFGRRQFGDGSHDGYSKANYYCIGIELCHEDWEGSFSPQTRKNAVELCARLSVQLHRDPWRDIITHNIVVGWKDCPRWFVKNPGELQRFQAEVGEAIAT